MLEHADSIALDTWWDPEFLALQRSREHFRDIARRGLLAITALYRRAPQVRAQWRTAHPRLTSETFWNEYLCRRATPKVAAVVQPQTDLLPLE